MWNNKFLIAVALTVVGVFAILAWLLTGQLTPAKIKILHLAPIPVAFVGSEPIYINNIDEVKNFFQNDIGNPQSTGLLLENFRYKQLAKNLGLRPLNFNETDLKSVEDIYGYKMALKLYFNSNEKLNQKNFELAKIIKQRLEKGEDVQSLSNIYNQDEFSKAFGGETGAIKKDEILPEIAPKLGLVGETKIIPSRYGLHIIKTLAEEENLIWLAQVFLTSQNFESWLESSAKEIKIKTFLSLN